MIKKLQERRAALKAELEALVDTAEKESRGLTTDEDATFTTKATELRQMDARIAELQEAEVREATAAKVSIDAGLTSETAEVRTSNARVTDPQVYLPTGANGNSYFRDMARVALNPEQAQDSRERLVRHGKAHADEVRALGNTNTTGGSGGEFAPPTWLVSDYIRLARMGRVTADLFQRSPVPTGTSSISIPKVLTGTTVALQSTQNTALSQTDLTTGSVSTGFSTVGGKQVVSQQLLDQSALNFDQVITADLAAAYAQNIGSQVIYGAGTGANNNSVVNGLTNATVAAGNQTTFTSASPTAALFYSKAAGMLSGFVSNRLAAPTVWLMHPRRFYWLVAQVDTNGRPLVVPTVGAGQAFNALGTFDGAIPAGATGTTFLGLPVFIDPQLPTNLGAGTNQDEVFLLKADDLWLFESPTQAEVFREPYADTVGVLFRLYAYTGTILNRYGTSIATMNGTGLIAPTF